MTTLITLAATITLLAALDPAKPATSQRGGVRIVLAGDSTVTTKDGWGAALARMFDDEVEVINMALGGRSSRSFMDEGQWEKCLQLRPDYIFIQFGHNDQPGKGPHRETDPETTYKQFMQQYIRQTLAIGAVPIVVTSLERRNFNPDGSVRSTVGPYAAAARDLAATERCALIDLNRRSIELYENLGEQASQEQMSPLKEDGSWDTTHLHAEGAKLIATLVADEIRHAAPELAKRLRS